MRLSNDNLVMQRRKLLSARLNGMQFDAYNEGSSGVATRVYYIPWVVASSLTRRPLGADQMVLDDIGRVPHF